MKTRLTVIPIIAGLVLALSLFAGACSGGDGGGGSDAPTAVTGEPSDGGDTPEPGGGEPTETSGPSSELEAYFQDLDDAENKFRAGQETAGAAFADVDETTPIQDVIDLLTELRDVIDEFVANLEDIDPPPEAEAAHNESIAGFQVASDAIGEALDAADSGTTTSEVLAIFEAPEVVQAETALDATCEALQTLADDNGIAVDLSCQH